MARLGVINLIEKNIPKFLPFNLIGISWKDMNNFYVYIHRYISDGRIAYIGSGTNLRYKSKSNRTSAHRDAWEGLNKQILIHSLNKEESLHLEKQLIDESIKNNLKLLNKVRVAITRDMQFEYFKDYLYYDTTSPSCLRWKSKTKNGLRNSGDIAGTQNKKGYFFVKIEGVKYAAHRIVFLLHNKRIDPKMVIDHIDGNIKNNNITNLRELCHRDNSLNITRSSEPHWHSVRRCWIAGWTEVSNSVVVRKSKAFNPRNSEYRHLDEEYAIIKSKQDAVDFLHNMRLQCNFAYKDKHT